MICNYTPTSHKTYMGLRVITVIPIPRSAYNYRGYIIGNHSIFSHPGEILTEHLQKTQTTSFEDVISTCSLSAGAMGRGMPIWEQEIYSTGDGVLKQE